jgi:serine/threonine-protein kinase
MIGQTVSHYKITEKLGEGGMGEVFRAHDTKLNRDVALKILPKIFAQDSERMGRFEREAQILASLNHPHIAQIYGVEEISEFRGDGPESRSLETPGLGRSDSETQRPGDFGTRCLVLELVEGETLAERIERGPIAVDETLELVSQIVEGLEAAHGRGIIHRDLKPANIKISPAGQIKILDFGLAKAFEGAPSSGDPSNSPTISHLATQAGVILGTASYMSPEQAKGKLVDKRADIWAFGTILYEMLAGQRLFEAPTVPETLAHVLTRTPDLTELPDSLPLQLRQLLNHCLEPDPRNRLRDIGDARIFLKDTGDFPEEPVTTDIPRRPWREALPWILAVGALCLSAGLVWKLTTPSPGQPVTRFAVTLPTDQRVAFIDMPILSLSPDGRKLAFTVSASSGQTMIHLRTFDQAGSRPLRGTEGGRDPFFSPDGTSLGFFADGRLKTVPLEGGQTLAVAAAPNARGGVWMPDNSIVFSPDFASGLWRVPASGGAAEPVVEPKTDQGERTFRWPDRLPGGHTVLFTLGFLDSPNDYTSARVEAFSFESGQRRVLIEGAEMARFVPPAHLVYSRAGVLFTVPLDLERLEVIGQPSPVLEGVSGDPSSGATYFAISSNGTLAFVRGARAETRRVLTLVNRKGEASQVPLAPRGFSGPRFSPEGSRLAFAVGASTGVGTDADVWVYSLSNESLSRLTFGGNNSPIWTPDGAQITYLRAADQGVLMKAADGSGSEETLMPAVLDPILPGQWSPDGSTLAFTRIGSTMSATNIFLLAPGEDPQLFEVDASGPAISPDGRWIAYASPAVGQSNVFVRPISGEGKWQVSPEIGSYPRWSGDGRELFYLGTGTQQRPLMVVDVVSDPSFRAGPPRTLISDLSNYVTATAPQLNWDVDPKRDRFVFVEIERERDEGTRIEVALYWAQHLMSVRP